MNIFHTERTMEATAAFAAALNSLDALKAAVAERSPEFQAQINAQMPELESYFENASDLLNTYSSDPNTTDEKWAVLINGCNALNNICAAATDRVNSAASGDAVLSILRQAKNALRSLFPWWIKAGIAIGIGALIYGQIKER